MANDKIDVVVGKKAFDEVGKLKIELEGLIKTFNELYALTKQSGGNPFGLPKQGTAKAAKQGLTDIEKAARELDKTNKALAATNKKIAAEEARASKSRESQIKKESDLRERLRTQRNKEESDGFKNLRAAASERKKLSKATEAQINKESALRERLRTQRNKEETDNLRNLQKAAQATKKLTKEKADEVRKTQKATEVSAKLGREYNILTAKMNAASKVVQDLNAKKLQGKKLSDVEQRELKQSTKDFQRYQKAVLGADVSVGRFQRNVGNYSKGFAGMGRSLRSLMGAFGMVGGVYLFATAVRDTFKRIKDFDKAMQNISGVMRTTRSEIADLEETIIKVAGASVRTSNEVAALAESLTTLGKSKKEVQDLLKPVIDLSLGLNASADEAGEFLVQMLNTFGASTDEAGVYADTIATIRTSTTLDFQKMRDSFQYLAPISKALNKDLAYTGSLVGILADNGIKAERAGRLLGTAQLKLAGEGLTLDDALTQLNDKIASGAKEIDVMALASDLLGKQSAGLGFILAANSDDIDTNADAIRNNSGALEDLVSEQLKSLDAQLNILNSAWEEYILGVSNSTNSTNIMMEAVAFLARNLREIINAIGIATGVFVAYKAILIAVNVVKAAAAGYTIAYRIALIAMNRGVLSAIRSIKLLRLALISTGIGAAVVLVGALVYAFFKLNKSVKQTADELHDASDEFITQRKETEKLNKNLSDLAKRHDELKGKTNLNSEEQKELNKIIKKIGADIPSAVTAVDKYGNAIEVNTGKVIGFNKANNAVDLAQAKLNVENQTVALKIFERQMKRVETSIGNEATGLNKLNGVRVEGLGTVKDINGSLFLNNAFLGTNTALTLEQQLTYEKYVRGIEIGMETAKADILMNDQVIASITGVKTARQLANDISGGGGSSSDNEGAKEVLRVKDLRAAISDLKKELKSLTKDGYEELNQTELDNIVTKRESLGVLEQELSKYIGSTKAIKDNTDAKKEEEKALKDAFELKKYLLEQEISFNESIINDEEGFYKERIEALENFQLDSQELSALNRDNELIGLAEGTDAFKLVWSKYYDEILKVNSDVNNKLNLIPSEIIDNNIDDEIIQVDDVAAIRSLAEQLGFDPDDIVSEYEKFNEEMKRLYGEDAKSFSKFVDLKSESSKELSQKREQLERDLTNSIISITDSLFQNQSENYDRDIEENNLYYANLLNNEQLNEEQRRALEAEREAKNVELQNKKEEVERKSFIFQQAAQAAIIIVDTIKAVAAIKAQAAILASNPVTAPLAAGALAQIPFVIGSGAAAGAAVLGTTIRAFKDGKKKGQGKDGMALVNDGGRDEIKLSADGTMTRYSGRNVLDYVKSSDTIIPNADSYMRDLNRASVMASLQNNGANLSNSSDRMNFDMAMYNIESKMESGIKKGFKGVRMNIVNNIKTGNKDAYIASKMM